MTTYRVIGQFSKKSAAITLAREVRAEGRVAKVVRSSFINRCGYMSVSYDVRELTSQTTTDEA